MDVPNSAQAVMGNCKKSLTNQFTEVDKSIYGFHINVCLLLCRHQPPQSRQPKLLLLAQTWAQGVVVA